MNFKKSICIGQSTNCQLAGLEDPLVHNVGPKFTRKFHRYAMQGRPKTDYKKALRGGMPGRDFTAGSGSLSNKIINVQSAGCACMSICDSRDQGAFSMLNKNAVSQLLKPSEGISNRSRDPRY
jgi:hypothetical protein